MIIFVLVSLIVVFGPLLTIWALNVLFGLAIPYTIQTWAATLILQLIVHSPTSHRDK